MENFIIEDINELDDAATYKSVMYEEIAGPNGKPLFKRIKPNTTTLGGSDILAGLFCGEYPGATPTNTNVTPTLFTTVDSGLTAARGLAFPPSIDANSRSVIGVIFGLDGSVGATDILPVQRHTKNFDALQLIPMRRLLKADDNPMSLSATYNIRGQTNETTPYIEYFMKAPSYIGRYNMTKSGIVFNNLNPDTQNIIEDVVSVVTMTVDITATDMAEYFADTVGGGDLNLRRFNSAMIVYGDKVTATDGVVTYTDYRNIKVTNRFNLPSRALGKYGTGKYIFNIYFK